MAFDHELNSIFLQQNFKKCPLLSVKQVIIHPGDINVIKRSNIDPNGLPLIRIAPLYTFGILIRHMHVPHSKENIPAESQN